MTETVRGLNDTFVTVREELLPTERKDYVPGDVNREKVYATWDALFESKKKRIPEDPDELAKLGHEYMDSALRLVMEGKREKGYAFAYFSGLLALKVCIKVPNENRELTMRHKLRRIERMFREENLLPKLPTAK